MKSHLLLNGKHELNTADDLNEEVQDLGKWIFMDR